MHMKNGVLGAPYFHSGICASLAQYHFTRSTRSSYGQSICQAVCPMTCWILKMSISLFSFFAACVDKGVFRCSPFFLSGIQGEHHMRTLSHVAQALSQSGLITRSE